jgi:hypothetical protein
MTQKLPVHIQRVELSGEYAGFWLDVRTNPPMRVFEEFASGDISRVIGALAVMTRDSNLVDESDQPVDLTTVSGWKEMPADLLGEVAERLREHLGSPKASSNGSTTPSLSEKDLSPASTT